MALGTFYPAVSGDDGIRWSSAGFDTGYPMVYLGGESALPYKLFIRFLNIIIPQGATITSAFIKFTANSYGAIDVCNEELSFNNVDNAVAPTNYPQYDALAKTSATIGWNGIGTWILGSRYDSPDISIPLQEIIDRAGWSSGNALMLIGDGAGSTTNAYRKANSYDNGSGYAELHVEWEEELGINLTEPLSAETFIQSDIKITAPQAQLLSEASMSVGSIFAGILVNCTSPLTAISSLQAGAKISIPSVSLAVQSEVQSDIQVSLPSALFSAQSGISIGNILLGYIINLTEALLAQSGLQVRPQIGLTAAQFTATSGLSLTPEIQLFFDPLIATASLSATPEAPFTIEGHPRVYLFTLTGKADGVEDITIPISSFQSRIKSGDPTFLSVVVPGLKYASYINDRPNGDLVVRMGYKNGNTILLTEIIAQVAFENVTIHDGATNQSITMDGHKTETWIVKKTNLTKASYMNLSGGKLRYRCKPDLYLRPGDTVNINDDTFVVDSIVLSVSPALETYEVAE